MAVTLQVQYQILFMKTATNNFKINPHKQK